MDTTISQIQKILLPLAIRIKNICDENNIKYSLEGGSLLGAIRHKGFIPWDNDFDFIMTRENYDRFLEVAKKELDDDYYILTYFNNDHYPFSFSKICINNYPIKYFDQSFSFETKLHIDVFPFDYAADNNFGRFIQKTKAVYYKRMLIVKDGGIPEKSASILKKILFGIAKLASCFYSHDRLVRKSEANLRKYKNTNYMSLMMGVYGYERTMIPAKCFDSYDDLPFEDTSFSCIHDYDKYLKQLYGNYMELPPVEKRCGHDFTIVE